MNTIYWNVGSCIDLEHCIYTVEEYVSISEYLLGLMICFLIFGFLT